jgi:hypothetical protein
VVLNALWNYAFFEYRSTLVGSLGMIGSLGPLLVLQTARFVYDAVAAWVHVEKQQISPQACQKPKRMFTRVRAQRKIVPRLRPIGTARAMLWRLAGM